jgi:glycosyltransferase involved in cell wall biosynthesis
MNSMLESNPYPSPDPTPLTPKFSIVVPTYNRPDYLRQCLQSLAQINYPRDRFEVIVVDDGSAQPMDVVVNPFQASLNLTLVRKANGGPARARNTGAALAQGQYLVFTDDDCQPVPHWLHALETELQHQPLALIGGHTTNALPDNVFSTASQVLIDYLYDYYNAHQSPSFFASNNFAMTTEQFRQLGGFDTSFPLAAGEDREFCDRWLQHKLPMGYAAEMQVYHTHHLSLKRFWRQHFNYGRGAYCFHQAKAHRANGHVKVEPLRFYWRLLTYPLKQHQPKGGLLSGLLLLSQVANAVGFLWERNQQRSTPTSAAPC